jgi:hypothetical protein
LSLRGSKPSALPTVTVKNVHEFVAAAVFAGGSTDGPTIASLPHPVVLAAGSSVRALLDDAGYFRALDSTLSRAREASVEEQLFLEFVARVLDGGGASAAVDSTEGASSTPSPSSPPLTLKFESEDRPTLRSAFVTLVHLVFAYEGFRSVQVEKIVASAAAAGSSAAPSASTSVHSFLPPSWRSFTSHQSSYTLEYQHLSLTHVLPLHVVTVKIVTLFGSTVVVHASFNPDVTSNLRRAGEEATESSTSDANEDMLDADHPSSSSSAIESSGLSVAPKIYSLRLDAREFVRVEELESSTTPDPSKVFRNISALLAQFRNRMFKHMLGEEYRTINSRTGGERTGANTSKEFLMMIPQEIVLAILQHLTSKGERHANKRIDAQESVWLRCAWRLTVDY